jgi:hypothetical protein
MGFGARCGLPPDRGACPVPRRGGPLQSGSLELATDSLLYLATSMRDRGTSVTVYPEGMILRNPRTWKAPMGASGVGVGPPTFPCVRCCL